METVETTPVAVPAPVVNTPAIEPALPAPAPAPIVAPVVMQEPKKNFFDGISMTDVIVGIGVVTALTLASYYYYNKSKRAKGEFAELRSELDSMKKKLEDEQPEQPANNQFGY